MSLGTSRVGKLVGRERVELSWQRYQLCILTVELPSNWNRLVLGVGLEPTTKGLWFPGTTIVLPQHWSWKLHSQQCVPSYEDGALLLSHSSIVWNWSWRKNSHLRSRPYHGRALLLSHTSIYAKRFGTHRPVQQRRHAESPSAMLGSNGTSAPHPKSSSRTWNRRTPQTGFLFC